MSAKEDPYQQRQEHLHQHQQHHHHDMVSQRAFHMEDTAPTSAFDTAAAVAVATGFEDGPSGPAGGGGGGGAGVLDPEIMRPGGGAQYAQQSSFFPMSLGQHPQGQYRSLQTPSQLAPHQQPQPQQSIHHPSQRHQQGSIGMSLQTTQSPLPDLENSSSLKENSVQFMANSKHHSPSSSSGRSDDAAAQRETMQILQMAAGMSNSGFEKEQRQQQHQHQRFRMNQFSQFPQSQSQSQLYDPSVSSSANNTDTGMAEFSIQHPHVVRYSSRVRNTSRQVHPSSNGGRRRRIRLGWTKDETENLMQGCKTHGVGNWKKILTDPNLKFNSRTAVDLKDRFRTSFPEEYARLYPNARTHKQKRKRSSSGELVVDSIGSTTTPGGQIVPAHPDSLDPATATLSSDSILSADTGLVKINRKERRSFTADEDEALLKGFEKYGPAWSRIQRDTDFGLMDRRSTDLRDRFRNAFPDKYIAAGYKGRTRKNSSSSSTNQQLQANQSTPRNAQMQQQPSSQDLLGISSTFLQTQPQQPSRYYMSNVNGR
ncbi:hypothetical protein TRVA0_005S00760 [Trichomonascus vanleenenianus]|uniref:telomere repeat binding factor family protein n=1 Tax=Trichomonascus vanleenenianus TaxID=2268995 RepID=UPI003ECADF5E